MRADAIHALETLQLVSALDVDDTQGEVTDAGYKTYNAKEPILQLDYHRRNSPYRPGRVLTAIVPPLLGLFILYGWHFTSSFIIPYLQSAQDPAFLTVLAGFALHILLSSTFALFVVLWQAPQYHSLPFTRAPREVLLGPTIPHEVSNLQGEFSYCWQDDCNGRIIPPRARHCKDCRTCRLDFDHHCPWLGCIARDTLKPFIQFLLIASITIIACLMPICQLAWQQCKMVCRAEWTSEWMYGNWWNRWHSWIGGPVPRYMGAVVLSYYRFEQPHTTDPSNIPAVSVTLLFYTVMASILVFFTAILFIMMLRQVLQGTSTMQLTRNRYSSRQFVRLPAVSDKRPYNELATQSRVVDIPASIGLYDFGSRENFMRVFGRSPSQWIIPWSIHTEPVKHWRISPSAAVAIQTMLQQQVELRTNETDSI